MKMNKLTGRESGKRRNENRRKYLCLLAAVLLLGGCGQAAGNQTAGGTVAEDKIAEEKMAGETIAEEEMAGETTAGETTEGKTAAASEAAETAAVPDAAAPGEELSVQEMYDLITESVTLISPVIMQDNFIENYYNIDPALLEEYVFSMSEEATSAETVVIMKLKDKADAGTISAALQLVIEEKSGEMENYLPDQYDIVKKSAVKTEGSYVYLVISEQADTIEKIIEAQL